MKDKISVIIPVYNSGQYLEKCIESLINQTYSNIEFIFVNDCSTDNSLTILQKYNNKKNIMVLQNKENKGAGFCRNKGLVKATGSYIGFIDSDDYIDKDYYEKMYLELKKSKADVVISDIKIIYEDNRSEIVPAFKNGIITKSAAINTGFAASSCNKLFKRKLFDNAKYEEGKINEDVAAIIPLVANAKKISYVKDNYYYYIQHSDSVQNTSFSYKKFDIFPMVDLALRRIKKDSNYEIIKDSLIFHQIILLLFYVISKEKNIIKLISIIRTYSKKTRQYNLKNNKEYKEFYNKCGKKHQIYYGLLLSFVHLRLNILSAILIVTYNILWRIMNRTVIKKNIDLNLVIKEAKKNSKRKSIVNISVVIPNYNYSNFLYQRVYSILSQKYKIYEIIILDDYSLDNSKEVIDKVVKGVQPFIKIKKNYNNKNSGSAFRQWEKGFSLAAGDYVWIAEADDYSNNNFLKKIVKPVEKDNTIVISYSDTAFINKKGSIILRSIKNEIDLLKTGHWDKNFINDGIDEIKNYSYLNCTIANVSSAIIKNNNYKDYFDLSKEYKQAGDWLFYINVMKDGKISYITDRLNYYRVHGDNVTSTTNKEKHFLEIQKVHKYISNNIISFDNEMNVNINNRYIFLEKIWNINISKKL